MSILRRIGLKGLVVLAFTLVIAGCGSTSNNDNGASFLALGFFADATGEEGDVGTVVAISETVPGSQGVFPLFVPVDKDPEEDGVQGGFVGLENRLATQFLRTVRLDCSHEVPGADAALSIPSDSWAFTTVIPASPELDNPSQAFAQVEIVSPDVIQFLNVNQNYLPELPFRMISTCTVVGVTQAGDTLTTNDVFYSTQFTDEASCASGLVSSANCSVPFNTGPGSGGTISTFGDPDPENVDESGGSTSADEISVTAG